MRKSWRKCFLILNPWMPKRSKLPTWILKFLSALFLFRMFISFLSGVLIMNSGKLCRIWKFRFFNDFLERKNGGRVGTVPFLGVDCVEEERNPGLPDNRLRSLHLGFSQVAQHSHQGQSKLEDYLISNRHSSSERFSGLKVNWTK